MSLKISKSTKIGFFITIAIAILIWGVNYLKGINFFRGEDKYYVVYERIEGLVESSPVLINGFQVGQIRDIHFHPGKSGKIVVSFVVDDEFKLPKYTIARIYSSDIMGTKAIELILGRSLYFFHNLGDTLLPEIEGTLKETVNAQVLPIKKKAEDLLLSIDSVMTVVQFIFNEATRDNLSQTFEGMKATILNLEKISASFDILLVDEKGKIADIFSNIESITSNLKNNNEALTNVIENFSSISDTIAKSDIANTIYNANKALTQVNELIGKINKGEGTMGLLINNDKLYNDLQDAACNLNKLLEDLKENPKRYVHYSLFDFGRTKIVSEEEEKKKKKDNNK